MKGSKWQYIQKKCIEQDLMRSAELAQAIDDALIQIYGDSSTPDWRKMREDHIALTLREAIASRSFCRGCVDSERRCHLCSFGKSEGVCCLPDSLFNRFVETFEREKEKQHGK